MDTKQPLSVIVVAILVASVFSMIGLTSVPLQNASAQTVTIETSADELGGTFFGEAMLQVIIEDSSTDDDLTDTLDVEVTMTSSGDEVTQSITIPDTTAGSQRFEFYIVHVNATDQSPADPEDTAALTDDQILQFGAAGGDELALPTVALYDDASFDILVGNTEVTIDYEEATGLIQLDRESYGSTNLAYFSIVDQDGNLDPTAADAFTVLDADLDLLFTLNGAAFVDDVTFDETGDNTAVFEATIQLNTTDSATDDELDISDESVQVTLNDMANYEDAGFNNGENDSTDTDDVTFTVDDVDGDFEETGTVTFGSELVLVLNDNDQNIDSEDDDTMDNVAGNGDGEVTVSVDAADGDGDSEVVPMDETGDNTGIFEVDLSNGELPITFLGVGQTPTANNGILELRRNATTNDITEDILLSYLDPLNDDSAEEETASRTIELDITDGAVGLPDTVGVNDDFTFTLTEPDFNNNPRTKDSYSFILTGDGGADTAFDITRGGVSLGGVATIEVDISSLDDVPTFATALTYTLIETGINTGIFEVELDMGDIVASAGADVDDGDELEITYNDFMDDSSAESSDEVSIGEADVGIDFSRSTVPIPPEAGSATADLIGDTVVISATISDPDENTDSGIENVLEEDAGADFQFESDPGVTTGPSFRIELDGELDGVVDTTVEYNTLDLGGGTNLVDILPALPTFTETGDSTGVFDDELEFVNGGVSTDDWHDLQIELVYIDRQGDEESAGFTFRGNDGIVTVDQSSAKAGTMLTISVQDEDLNLDDGEVEEFEGSADDATVDDLLTVETEDDDIDGVSTETYRETGADTGIFTAEYEVGDDIPVSVEDADEITQATNILITYNDEIDSTGGGGDEFEINVPVVSSTGSIHVTPELVGPGTTLNVQIVDSDLDQDSGASDEYDTTDPDGDDFFVSFRSDRSEVEEGSPDLDETGPNTGIFEFEIELVTDATACGDDDLDSDDFDGVASGGSEPSIGACPGDLLSITYEDEQDSNGQSTTVSALVEVKAWDPEFASDKDSYAVGDRATITISDPDANTDPDVADSLSDIRVWSDSDAVGDEFSALETGEDTGVFTLSFLLSSGTESGAITVKTGDDVSIEYTDEFPADFEDSEEDKDFVFSVPIGAAEGGTGTTTPGAPSVQDSSGVELDDVSAGQQVVLATIIINNVDEPTPFTALIEVRDSNDVTVYLAWQTGVLAAGGQSEVGLSWTPENPGDYTVRTFVISDLDNPRVLSLVVESDITVS